MKILTKNIKIDKLIEELMEELMENLTNKNIYNFVNLKEIRKLLVNYPQLCIMFEMLCIHINTLIEISEIV